MVYIHSVCVPYTVLSASDMPRWVLGAMCIENLQIKQLKVSLFIIITMHWQF